MILLCRRIFQAVDETRANTFNKSQESRFEVQGKTLGLLGLGNIGKQVAQLAQALGMKIVFYDNRDVAKEVGETMGWSFVPNIADLFAASDVVSAHISASDYRGRSNENLLQLEHFAAMAQKERPSPRLFINAARGQIHDTETLIEAVNRGYIGAAMVDVFPVEPSDAKDPGSTPTPATRRSTLRPTLVRRRWRHSPASPPMLRRRPTTSRPADGFATASSAPSIWSASMMPMMSRTS